MDDPTHAQAARVFAEHRSRLLGLAYRLLGRTGEAEEALQDAFVRWLAEPREDVRDPYAFLVTTVTRLALDRLTSARARRETYVGEWLPEPLMVDGKMGPLDTLEQQELLSIGMLRLLERLSPPERGVFVLREAFDLGYDEIGNIVGLQAAHCRQLHARAQKHLAERTRFSATREEHLRVVTDFLDAVRSSDAAALGRLVAPDVVAYGDGGGRVHTTLKPVVGAERVIRFFLSLSRRFAEDYAKVQVVELNGKPALLGRIRGDVHAVSFAVEAGRIVHVYDVANPDKLTYLHTQRGA